MATLTALLDACVLYPQTLRDLLLNLARTDLFRARWTDLINNVEALARGIHATSVAVEERRDSGFSPLS